MKIQTINRAIVSLLVVAVILCAVVLVRGEYIPQQQNTNFTLVVVSNNATECNLTSITYPDGSATAFNIKMNKVGQTFSLFIYQGNYTLLGDECHQIVCSDGNQYETGSICRTITGNGNRPEGSVIVLFSLILLVIMGFLIYEFIVMIGHFAGLDIDVVDLAKYLGTYFALFALYQLGIAYLGNPTFNNWILLFIKIGAFTHVIVPITGFLISITIGSLSKKNVDFGTKRIYRRTQIGKV